MNTQTKAPAIDREAVRRFVEAVPVGAARPATAEALCWQLGIVAPGTPTTDNHRRLIRAYREAAAEVCGVVVLGANDGYYIPATLAEVDAAHGRRRSQIATMADGLRVERELAERMFTRQQLAMAWATPDKLPVNGY